MEKDKADSKQLNRSFDDAKSIASSIITGVLAKQDETGKFGGYEALEKEATKWIEDYANGTKGEQAELRGWDWDYARWLVMLRKALLATGCFENGVYPDAKAWRDYYDYTKLTPYEAAKKDTGVTPSFFYRSWNGKYPDPDNIQK